MGDHVYIAPYCSIDGSQGLSVGEGTQISSWVAILTHSSHQAIRLYGRNYSGDTMLGCGTGEVCIGKYVFIGAHAIIMPSTSIGKKNLIRANSYVRGVFPDGSMIAGSPEKKIGDTRDLDQSIIDANPSIMGYYDEWATTD